MKTFLIVVFVFIILNQITESFKIKEKENHDPINNQSVAIESDKDMDINKNSAENGLELAFVKNLANDNEYDKHTAVRDTVKRNYRNKRHEFERNKRKQRVDGFRKNSIHDECSFGKERADDGNCVSIEMAANSSELLDIDERINLTTWIGN